MIIHPTAIIDKNTDIATDAEIGPHAIIEANVKIAKGVKILANVYISSYTEIGEKTIVHMGAVLGNVPQDLAFEGKRSSLSIGRNNIIREYVTVHRGTKENTSTIIGDNNFLMAASHVGHNCHIGNQVVIANGVLLAGYVTVEDAAFISGNVVVHQFCRIGKLSMIGGFSGVNKDVPPYMSVRGPSVVWSINLVGLRRSRFTKKTIDEIKKSYNFIYQSELNTEQAIKKILEMGPGKEVMHLVDFIRNSKRGICKYRFEGEDREYFI